LAHSLHMHMCRQGKTVVSRGSVMQMTHLVMARVLVRVTARVLVGVLVRVLVRCWCWGGLG